MKRKSDMKKAFTMVELLVVIAIIGMLMGALVYYLGNTESAHAAKCKANLKNLANAVSAASIAQDGELYYPLAGSHETVGIVMNRSGNSEKRYGEMPGWISWNSDGAYYNNPKDSCASAGWFTSAYNQDDEVREYCITNGTLYKYVKNIDSYVCPRHRKKMPSDKRPAWSYVMNGRFKYDSSMGEEAIPNDDFINVSKSSIKAHSTLLFAELQWEDYIEEKPDFSSGSGFKNDSTLQYSSKDGSEIIGFNHKAGKDIVAHVAFADGHVDVIYYPKKGMSKNQLEELTQFLCRGIDYEIRDGSVNRLDE